MVDLLRVDSAVADADAPMRRVTLDCCRQAYKPFSLPHPHPLKPMGFRTALVRGAILISLLPRAQAVDGADPVPQVLGWWGLAALALTIVGCLP